MRITAGDLKNQNVIISSGLDLRPTGSKIRQALFNILFSLEVNFEAASLLDLFSGSGIISFEFLSRGLKTATLVDDSKNSLDCSVKNSKNLKIFENLKFVNKDALKFVETSEYINDFDIFYLDPPYKYQNYSELVELVLERKNAKALVIVESNTTTYINDGLKSRVIKEKSWGETFLVFYK